MFYRIFISFVFIFILIPTSFSFFYPKINKVEIVKIDTTSYDYEIIWKNGLIGLSYKVSLKYLLSEDYIFEINIDKLKDFWSLKSLQIIIDNKFYSNTDYYYFNTENKFYFWSKDLRQLFLKSEKKSFNFELCYNSIDEQVKCLYSDDIKILDFYERYNDTYSYLQYYLKDLKIDKVKESVKNNYTPVIAIIDDWIIINHKDLDGKHWINSQEIDWNWIDDDNNWYIDDYYGRNFIYNNNNLSLKWFHGTHVAWVIWANTNNNFWVTWIINDVKLMPLIACKDSCKADDIAKAISYAVYNKADIINLSLGWDYIDVNNKNIFNAIKYAVERNVVIVSSAWNWYDLKWGSKWIDTTVHKIFPVCDENVSTDIIWVSALSIFSDRTKNWLYTYRSNYWICADIAVPWSKIVSLSTVWWYSINSWTSFSAPIITWIIWLWYNQYWKVDSKIVYKSLISSYDKWYWIDAEKYIKELWKNLKK